MNQLPLRAAIIGMGGIGRVHAEALVKCGENLVALCDTDTEKTKSFPLITYTDYKEMLRQETPDVVHVCTPHYLHADMVIYALEHGINVLCEKPLCILHQDIPRILEAAKKSTAQLGVCHQNRYNPSSIFLKEYLKDKEIKSAYGTVVWNRDAAYYASGMWRGKLASAGGGVLMNQALHTLDLLQWIVGTPQYVTASVTNLTLPGLIEVEDTASAIFTAKAEFSLLATIGSKQSFPVGIYFETSDHSIAAIQNNVFIDGKFIEFPQDGHLYGKLCYGTGHEKLINDFYDCVKSNRRFTLDGAEGAKVIELILACYESKGMKIPINNLMKGGIGK